MFSFQPSPPVRWLLLGLLVLAHFLAVFSTAGWAARTVPASGEDHIFGLMLGLCSGMVSNAAVLLALGPGRLVTRISSSLLSLALGLLPFLSFAMREGDLEMLLLIDGALLAQYAFVQLPLWIARTRRGWRLALPEQTTPADDKPLQFGTRQLMLWTAGVAVLLGLGRLVLPSEVRLTSGRPNLWELAAVFSLLMLFHTLLPLPIIVSAFARRWAAPGVLAALLFAVVLSVLEPWTFRLFNPGPGGEEHIFYWLNAAHAAWLLGSLLVVRLCGYRLIGAGLGARRDK